MEAKIYLKITIAFSFSTLTDQLHVKIRMLTFVMLCNRWH